MTNMKSKQILISHRGNLDGPSTEFENSVGRIVKCVCELKIDIEIDVWKLTGALFMGHDAPETRLPIGVLEEFGEHIWIHCKNLEALIELKDHYNCFFHDKDDYVLTSRNYIWAYPGKVITPETICVLPENRSIPYDTEDIKSCRGICSDYIRKYM